MFDNLNNLEASISAIRAFNHLIVSAIEQGDNISYVGGGIHHLLEVHVEQLERQHDQIRSDFVRLKEQVEELSINLILNRAETSSNGLENHLPRSATAASLNVPENASAATASSSEFSADSAPNSCFGFGKLGDNLSLNSAPSGLWDGISGPPARFPSNQVIQHMPAYAGMIMLA